MKANLSYEMFGGNLMWISYEFKGYTFNINQAALDVHAHHVFALCTVCFFIDERWSTIIGNKSSKQSYD